MASFIRPFDPTLVSRVIPDAAITLPDPEPEPDNPLTRPHVARFAGSHLPLLQVTANASFALLAPATAAVRNINLDATLAPGINQLLEISPLPFTIAPALRALQPGSPTFYVGFDRAEDTPADDLGVQIGESLGTVSSGGTIFLGALFQDGLSLAPWAWIDFIGAALAETADAGASAWNALLALYGDSRSLRLLGPGGQPPADPMTFEIHIHRADGVIEGPWLRTAGADADLETAVAVEPLDRPPGGVALQPSLFGAAGERTELRWTGAALPGEDPLPIHALYGTEHSSPPGQSLLLPAGIRRGHLQLLELASWFAPPPSSVNIAHFHRDSRVEPLVDGIPTFRRLLTDLLDSKGSGNGAHFAGWAFNDFEFDPGRLDDLGNEIDTTWSALIGNFDDDKTSARILINRMITLEREPTTIESFVAIGVLLLLAVAPEALRMETNRLGYFAVGLGIAYAFYKLRFDLEDTLANKEQSADIFPVLAAISDDIAFWSDHPARISDNPLDPTLSVLGVDITEFIQRFGTWHQKFQCFKRATPDDDGNTFVSYLGGIDINRNRLDTPGHQIRGPYHDVHARLTGPAAAAVFQTFDERWTFDQVNGEVDSNTLFDPPAPSDLANDSTRAAAHIVQVARTHYQTENLPGPFTDFAPDGERTIYNTLLRAIRAATNYIYIEDQYFTPNDRKHPAPQGSDMPDTYLEALLAAADHCRRLVILLPSIANIGNQPFGRLRRDSVLARLRDVWGDRMLVGAPMRRPVLPPAERAGHEGRCRLLEEINDQADIVKIGPRARVPLSNFYWLWIDGELMLANGSAVPITVDGKPGMEVPVMRGQIGSDRLWGASTRTHFKGAPVTMSQLRGIFVHAKVMMVDDIFVSIGSANVNRRGFFYDGEINLFAVPQQLAWAADNPARALRTALWAEQLNLPPAMGASLLADPIAAFDLFRRTLYAGNRFMDLRTLDLAPDLEVPLGDTIGLDVLTITGVTLTNSLIEEIWNTATDPTSFNEPDPTPGPLP